MAAARAAALLLLGLAARAAGKTQRGVVHLGPDGGVGAPPWEFAGKFGYAIGHGSYDVRVRLADPAAELASLDLEVFLDEEWDRMGALKPCRRAWVARKTNLLRATAGAWSPWEGGVLIQSVRPHIWYFALSACSGRQQNATLTVEYELRMTQFDGSEMSVELRHMPAATVLALMCVSGLLLRFATGCRRLRESCGSVQPVIRVLAGAALLQWTAQGLQLLHLLGYEARGAPDSVFEAAGHVLLMLSQVASSTLLILIAQGYTLDPSREEVWGRAKPVAAVVAMLHALLVGHAQLQGEHSDKHHENEGVVGWALLFSRLLLYVWFLAGARALWRSGGPRLQPFLSRFVLAGSMYFLAFPVLFVVVQLFAEYLQHPLLEIGMAATQAASFFWLSELFLTRGLYYQVSTLGASLLPGGFSPSSSPARSKRD
mmetsp:Transcript_90346/g.252510  ORF Transcript_90346/g.252510 Transcript_90346/m.252510 type:complete len:429 (-) Transcript_90346:115-1401(-)